MSTAILTDPKIINLRKGALQALLYLPGTTDNGLSLGYLGCLASTAEGGTVRAEDRITFLQEAKEKLFSLGAQKVIGPIDGDTWHRYRLPLTGSQGLTLLEPDYPAFRQNDFIAAGMPVIATYRTSLVSDLSLAMEKLTEAETIDQKTLALDGITIRCLKLGDYDNELTALHQFSLDAFKHNFLFSDIALSTFKGLYQPLKGLIREELVLIAQTDDKDNEILGVVLALPDPANRSTIIVKTLARHPFAPRGLGRFLFYEVLARAHQLGYSGALCALMKDDNFSVFLPDQVDGKVIRKFALFGCTK